MEGSPDGGGLRTVRSRRDLPIFAVDGLRMAIIFGIFLTLFRRWDCRAPRADCC